MSSKWSRTRFIGTIILVLFGMSLVGGYTWLKYGPENNVRMWLDKKTVQRDEPVKLYIRNLGSKSIGFGTPYYIYRIHENGTTTCMNSDWVWAAVGIRLMPFGTYSKKIKTDFDPGDYYVEKNYHIEQNNVQYKRRMYFTIE